MSSGAAALEYLRSNPCDVVVTDVHMAGMTGIELCEQLKASHTDVLAIVVTGNGELPTAVAAIRAGAFDFVTKPLKIDALSIAVSRALEHLGAQARAPALARARRRRPVRVASRGRARRSARRST